MSGLSAPTPCKNRFMPPPGPVDSISGDLNSGLLREKLSETALAKGNTVDEPTARIESRAPSPPFWPQAARARVESARRHAVFTRCMGNLFSVFDLPCALRHAG